jgi:hypothetical protein
MPCHAGQPRSLPTPGSHPYLPHRPTVGQVTGAISPLDIAMLKDTFTVGYLTVYVIDGYPLLPKV